MTKHISTVDVGVCDACTYQDTSVNGIFSGRTLYMENVSLQALAQRYGTPLYVYSLSYILRRLRLFTESFSHMPAHVHFAVKANCHQAILTPLARRGCGMDIVSVGELRRAVKAGVPANKIIFSGVSKTNAEIAEALQAGILQINVESVEELYQINSLAETMQCVAPIALRVNPNVDAKTHTKITTGQARNKFGINIDICRDLYRRARDMQGVCPQGIAVHIGSQIMTCEPFAKAYSIVADLAATLMQDGIDLKRLDLGGGLGIAYRASDTPIDIKTYAKVVKDATQHIDLDIHFEPGRWIVGNAGVLLSTVENIKVNDAYTFMLADVGMNDLIRPTLYDAYHHIVPVREGRETVVADVVGPVCESGDYMAKDRKVAKMQRGDVFALLSAGAYGMVQSSNYNSRPRAAEVLVKDSSAYLISQRETLEDIIDRDIVPQALA